MRKAFLTIGLGLFVGCAGEVAGPTAPTEHANGETAAAFGIGPVITCNADCGCGAGRARPCPPHSEFVVLSPPNYENLPPGQLSPDEQKLNERMERELDAQIANSANAAH
jgi:hypothetical protein